MLNIYKIDIIIGENEKEVTNMDAMFWEMTNLNTIYVSNDFNRTKITSSNNMFQNDNKLKGGLGTTLSTAGNVL